MAVCLPIPTLTLFSTTTSTNVITTSTVIVQTQPDGAVSTLTLPLIITTIITVVDPTSTLFASCSTTPISTTPSTTLPHSTTPQPSPSPSVPQYTPTTVVITTTPPPTVVTEQQSSTLNNGVVTVVTITTTSTPPPTVIVFPTSVAASQSQTSNSKSSSSNIVPIIGGAVGGFFFLIGAVLILWWILKKCRKPDTDNNREDEDIVFPYPVTRDRDETRRLDLAKESRPYEYGLVGRSMPTTSSGGPPSMTYDTSDGRPDSITALIGSNGGLPPTMSDTVASNPGTQTRGGEVGRQGSRSSTLHQLPPGAAPPLDRHSPSVTGSGSVSGSSTAPGPSNRRTLQVINPPLSPISPASIWTGFSPDDVPSSGSAPMVAPETEKQSVRSEKKSAHAFSSSSSGPILVHSDGGHIQGGDRRPSASGSGAVLERKPPAQPEPTPITTSVVDPTDAPPAYVA